MTTMKLNKTKVNSSDQSLWWLPLTHGLALLLLGFSLLCRQDLTMTTLSHTFGIYFLGTGVVNISTAVFEKSRRERIWMAVSGGINTLNGLVILFAAQQGFAINLQALLMILAGLASVNGMLFLIFGHYAESVIVEGWAWSSFILGVICLGFGMLFLSHLLIPVKHVMVFNAIWAILGGIGMTVLAFRIKKEEEKE